jgi:DNA-binding MarR family transcriptional regulator
MSINQALNQTKSYEIGMSDMLCSRKLNSLRQQVLAAYGLTGMEWFVLGLIYDAHKAGGIRITELATQFEVKSTYITALVNELKQKNLVNAYVDKEDARARLVVVTKKGMEQIPVIDRELQSATEKLLADKVDAKDLAAFLRTIKKIASIR